MKLLDKLAGTTINVGWKEKPPKESGADERAAALRLLIVNAVLKGKLGKADADEINKLIGGRPVAVYAKLAQELAERAVETSDLKADALLDMLSKGPAAALYKLATERKAAQEAFEQTTYSQKLRGLRAKRDAALAAFNAVEHDEDVTPEKKRRLLREREEAIAPLNALMNSRDPELIAYRDEAKKTADPTLDELKWESFAI